MAAPQTYSEFWPFYVREHGRESTRLLHFTGTAGAIALFVAAIWTGNAWYLVAMPVCGYGFAWVGHGFVEHNRPATFTYPLWSLAGDFHMFALMLAGRMGREVERHRDGPRLKDA